MKKLRIIAAVLMSWLYVDMLFTHVSIGIGSTPFLYYHDSKVLPLFVVRMLVAIIAAAAWLSAIDRQKVLTRRAIVWIIITMELIFAAGRFIGRGDPDLPRSEIICPGGISVAEL